MILFAAILLAHLALLAGFYWIVCLVTPLPIVALIALVIFVEYRREWTG